MAARKRSSRNRGNPNNPNTVLVVFMVFFILVSIGLGVGTYYGYAGQDKLKTDAINFNKEAKAAKNALEYYQFQALFSRAAEGGKLVEEPTDEKNTLLVAHDGFMDGSKFKDEKTRPEVEDLVKRTEAALTWNAGKKAFDTTWSELLKKRDADLKQAQADNGTLMAAKKAAETKLQDLQTKYDGNWTKLAADFKEGNAKLLEAARAKTAEMEEFQKANKQLADEREKLVDEGGKTKRIKDKMIKERNDKIAELEATIVSLKKEMQELAANQNAVSGSLMVGDFAGQWTGTLARGGAVDLDIKANGATIWTVPGIGQNARSGVSHLEKDKSGDNYVVSISEQPVRLFLAADRRKLRLAGGGFDATLLRK
jgi:hypothetical protein